MSDEIINYQNSKGTMREFTVHDSPQQNGVAERGMRTQAEQAHALLLSSGLPMGRSNVSYSLTPRLNSYMCIRWTNSL